MFFKKKKPSYNIPALLKDVPYIASGLNRETKSYIRRDTSDRWSEVNPVLEKDELGYEVDTRRIARGDGVSRWNDLDKATFN